MPKRLSQHQIEEIRRRRESGEKATWIAETMGVAASTVIAHTSDIVKRKRAAHICGQLEPDSIQNNGISYCERERLVHELCLLTARIRRELGMEKRRDPCGHCRWRLNGQPVQVCIGYCGRWKAPVQEATP